MNTEEAVAKLKQEKPSAVLEQTGCCGETTLEVDKANLKEVLQFFKSEGYAVLMDLTGVDYLVPHKRTKVLYWLHNPANYQRVRIIIYVDREGKLPSVFELWAAANWYERELYDLFGIRFEAHPDLTRILMPDDWFGHPLLRDYPLCEVPVQFKHGVKPKIPSQIIPYVQSSEKS